MKKMSENFIPNDVGQSIDISGGIREGQTKVTEQDVQRVQSQSSQAQEVFQQIQKDKKQNNQMAKFLTFLLQNVKNEKIISGIHAVFFRIKHPNQEVFLMRKNINTIVIVGMFAPFYPKEIKQFGLNIFFERIYDFNSTISLPKYLNYLKKLSQNYHDNIAIDKQSFLNFIEAIVLEYGLTDKSNLTQEKHIEFQKTLSKELYGS